MTALAALGTCSFWTSLWGPAPSRTSICKSSPLYGEAAGDPSREADDREKPSETEKRVGERVKEMVELLKAPNKSKARSLCEIGLTQTAGTVFPHHVLPFCQRAISLYGVKLCRCLSTGTALALFVSCFPGEGACDCSLMDVFYNPLVQIPSSGRRRTCGTG